MLATTALRNPRRQALIALTSLAVALVGCGPSRDTELAEKVARAEQAARDAEAAKRSIEQAAKAANARQAQSVVWDDTAPDAAGEDDSASNGQDDADKFDNTIAQPAPAQPAN